jgi:tripartite-type tricarboxylate transporter receptor subunit TctC
VKQAAWLHGLAGVAALALPAAAPRTAQAADYPVRPLRMIVAVPAGGGGDLSARWLAERMQTSLKQNVVVQNIGGAGGNIAAGTAARSTADGYTLFFAADPIFTANPFLYPKLDFDLRDFAPVAMMANTSRALVVHPSFPASTVAELVAVAKSKPGALNFGSGGVGTSLHLAGELLKSSSGIDIRHVPYRGGGPAMLALVGGSEIQLLFNATPSVLGHIRGGRVKGIAVATRERLAALPELPTFIEGGMQDFVIGVVHGILVPTGTTPAVIARLNDAVNRALSDAEYRKKMADEGVQMLGGSAGEFQRYLTSERKRWGSLIKMAGISLK